MTFMLSFAAGPFGLNVILAVLAAAAVASAVYAVVIKRSPHTALLSAMAGVLAMCYLVGYVYLIAFNPNRGHWSIFMGWFGLASWPSVWIFPNLYRIHKRLVIGDRVDV